MSAPCCGPAIRHFDQGIAEADLARYRQNGLDKRARLLLEGIRRSGLSGRSVLDVGSGAGALSLELLKAGAAHATLADASPAYLAVAKTEAARAGVVDRVDIIPGDVVETVDRIPPADIVVLDRVICCYPAWPALLAAAMSRGRALLGLTYPRARADVRLVFAFDNLRRRLKGDAFRAFVHPPAEMQRVLHDHGWRLHDRTGTFVWRVDLYGRE
jgi:magnesium-protoporphyrin O-methyltransferase